MPLAALRSKLAMAAFVGIALAVLAAWAYLVHAEREAHKAGDAAGYARGHAEYLDLKATMAEAGRLADRSERAKESARNAGLLETLDAKELQLQRARADRVIADASTGQLQQRIKALLAARGGAAGSDTAAAAGGEATDDTAALFADVLGRCVARVRQLADIADERGAAGSTCERAYDALTAEPPPPKQVPAS